MGKPGRPTFYGAKMRPVQMMLDEATVAHAREIGDGNMSQGIRDCVAFAWNLKDEDALWHGPMENPDESVSDKAER